MNWLLGMRGRLMVWYLSVLAALLFSLCVFQTITLNDYFRTSKSASMQQVADAELAAYKTCSLRTAADLRKSAQALSILLGSPDVSAAIVTLSGHVLAARTFGPYSTTRSSPLSGLVIHRLIPGTSRGPAPAESSGVPSCTPPPELTGSFMRPESAPPSTSAGNVLLISVPVGPPNHPVGYAILGRSVATETATLEHARLTLWLGALVVLIAAALVALPIINRALRPLTRVTRVAEEIAGGDLAQRANLSTPVDEIGRLGSAFDSMVDRLQEALAQATASEGRMRRFLADASHELRTPLTALRGTSQVLLRQDTIDPDDVQEALAAIHQEAARLSQLVDDLLRLSRLDSGQELEPRPVALSPFLEAFVARYASVWPERTIDVESGALDDARASVDPDALTRVLTNLVDNAARYSTAGRPILIAGASDGETVSIEVRDGGPGLPPHDATRMFERFYRGTQSRSRQSGGSGLGLAIVRALVEQSEGEIHVDTGPDRGTTVAITLPRLTERRLAVAR